MLCEKALYKRSAGITVCVSDGNNLCRIKGISGTASSVIKAQDRKRAARRPDDDGTCASGGDTRWTYLELTSTAFCIRLSRRSVPPNHRKSACGHLERCCASWNLDDPGSFHAQRRSRSRHVAWSTHQRLRIEEPVETRMISAAPVQMLISQRCHRTQDLKSHGRDTHDPNEMTPCCTLGSSPHGEHPDLLATTTIRKPSN